MSLFEKELQYLNDKLAGFCAHKNLPVMDFSWTPIPFAGQWGISTSFFQLASSYARSQGIKTNIPVLAGELADLFAKELGIPKGFSKVEVIKGYINLTFDRGTFIKQVVNTSLTEGKHFGRGDQGGKKVMVEYSQPNTHKAFHVGHLRNLILGSSVCEILEFAGFDVIRANYMGDIGLHVLKWLANYRQFHQGEHPPENITRWMGDLYAEADRRFNDDPEFAASVRELFVRWDQRDPEVVDLWQRSRQWSIDGFNQMYAILGAKFDKYYFPSENEDEGKALVADLILKGIATDGRPDEAVFINIDKVLGLSQEKYRVLVVLRSDGTSLYATTDLPLGIKKFKDYNLEKSIYVIDVRQSLYMQQIYKMFEIMGYDWASRCSHLSYEIVNLPGNVTMSSRDGTVVLLEDLLSEAISRAMAVVEKKNPSLGEEEKRSIGTSVALGAIKFSMLNRDNGKIVTFDWEEALNFDGQAAPYIQYAHVRANSILRKNQSMIPTSGEYSYPLEQSEVVLIDQISRFPAEVQRSAADLKPLYIANYAFKLAQSFNDFYNQCPVLQTTEPQRSARLRLVAAAKQTLANSLALLGITAPEAM